MDHHEKKENLLRVLQRLKQTTNYNVKVLHDIEYVEGLNAHPTKHLLNIHLPVDETGTLIDTDLPVVMHVHGGGWKRGDRNHEFYGAPFMCNSYARRLGFIGVAISYRLGIKHPESVYDVAKAIKWCYDNILAYGGNKDCFFVSGHSAGGHLVSLVTLDAKYLNGVGVPIDFIKGVMSISGVYTLSSPLSGEPNGFANWMFRKVYVQSTFGNSPHEWDLASPIKYIVNRKISSESSTSTSPPTEERSRRLSITASEDDKQATQLIEDERQDFKQADIPGLFSVDIAETSGEKSNNAQCSTLLVESKSENCANVEKKETTTSRTYMPPFLVLNAETDLGLQFDGSLFYQTLLDNGYDVEYTIVQSTNHASITRSERTVSLCKAFVDRILTSMAQAL